MLTYKDCYDNIEEKYHGMIKQVNIVEFTKCIAQYSGLPLTQLSDKAILEYLSHWAKNKYRFFVKMGNKLQYDRPIRFKDESKDIRACFRELESVYPAYALWLDELSWCKINKIDIERLSYSVRDIFARSFPSVKTGCSLTHFFKTYLLAPDDLVTKIGKIYENDEIEATFTISIDPVDMMLASENPYNWVSCYRLETPNDSSHADGCLAALLDDSSLITYVWNNHGKFTLYDYYDFKDIRYKRMRMWISINPDENAIHFNSIYPGKTYSTDFEKMLRIECENLVNSEATWKANDSFSRNCSRKYYYGYNEFANTNIYYIKDTPESFWNVYNTAITCPCGCGNIVPGSDECDGNEYDGEGFTAESFYLRRYCDIIDDYCENDEGCCEECPIWRRNNAMCELDTDHYCDGDLDLAEEVDSFDEYSSNIVHCHPDLCENCIYYKDHMKKMKEEGSDD